MFRYLWKVKVAKCRPMAELAALGKLHTYNVQNHRLTELSGLEGISGDLV